MVRKEITSKFTTVGEHLDKLKNMSSIFNLVAELTRITDILHKNLPDLRNMCHCGAVDYASDLLVIFTNTNGAFHIINNQVPLIQDCLEDNGIYFGKILVRNRPQDIDTKPKAKHIVGDKEYLMLKKFAKAISRPDLLKPQKVASSSEEALNWQIDF